VPDVLRAIDFGSTGSSLVLTPANGEAWGGSNQFRPLRQACVAAGIEPAISFHIPRHINARRLAMAGTSMTVVATQVGHTDTRMTERGYAHVTPNYTADVMRASFTRLGIVPASTSRAREAGRQGRDSGALVGCSNPKRRPLDWRALLRGHIWVDGEINRLARAMAALASEMT